MLREILQLLRSDYAFALITASLAVLVAVIAYELVGYLGLGILGLLTLLISRLWSSGRMVRSGARTIPNCTPGRRAIATGSPVPSGRNGGARSARC